MIFYIILIIMTAIGAFASLFLKMAAAGNGIAELLTNRNLYIGAMLYLLSAVLNIYILRYLDYSVVLPLTSLTYIWTMFISHGILKEKITKRKMIVVALILLGAILV